MYPEFRNCKKEIAMGSERLRKQMVELAPHRIALALAVCLLSVACGSSSTATGGGTTSANIAEAQTLVTKAEQPIASWQPVGGKFDASKAKGKTIWYISLSLSIPFEQFVLQGIQQGAALVGAKGIGFDGNYSPATASRGVSEAIQAKASLIMIDGFQPQTMVPAIAQAKAAGIPVLTANTQDPGPPLPGYPPGVIGIATHNYKVPGQIEADFVVADSKGKANVLFLSTTDVPVITTGVKDGFVNELSRLCPACKVTIEDVPSSQWSGLTPRTATLIASHPDVNYMVPDFDGMVIYMVPGVTSANAQNKVKIVSFNASPSVMKNLAQHNVVAGDTGGPNLVQGWAFADEALRILAGGQPVNDLNIPTRLFDSNNIGSIDLSKQESEWYGVGDYISKFKAQWGVS
jgi:ribose transport system substrate-binding protein